MKKEIVKMEESLKRQMETQESREVVTAEYQRLKEVTARADLQVTNGSRQNHLSIVIQVKNMARTVEYLGDMLTKRSPNC